MAILMVLEFDGVSVEQYAQVNESMGIRGDEDAPDGLVSHTAGVTDDGLLIVDVWDSEESLQRFFEGSLGAALAEAGLEQRQPRVLQVHNMIAQGAGTDAGVLMILESDEFTPELYDALTARMEAHAAGGGAHPAVSHVAALDGTGGMVFVDVWDSAESFGRFAEAAIGSAAEGGELPALEPRFVPVHNRLRGTVGV